MNTSYFAGAFTSSTPAATDSLGFLHVGCGLPSNAMSPVWHSEACLSNYTSVCSSTSTLQSTISTGHRSISFENSSETSFESSRKSFMGISESSDGENGRDTVSRSNRGWGRATRTRSDVAAGSWRNQTCCTTRSSESNFRQESPNNAVPPIPPRILAEQRCSEQTRYSCFDQHAINPASTFRFSALYDTDTTGRSDCDRWSCPARPDRLAPAGNAHPVWAFNPAQPIACQNPVAYCLPHMFEGPTGETISPSLLSASTRTRPCQRSLGHYAGEANLTNHWMRAVTAAPAEEELEEFSLGHGYPG